MTSEMLLYTAKNSTFKLLENWWLNNNVTTQLYHGWSTLLVHQCCSLLFQQHCSVLILTSFKLATGPFRRCARDLVIVRLTIHHGTVLRDANKKSVPGWKMHCTRRYSQTSSPTSEWRIDNKSKTLPCQYFEWYHGRLDVFGTAQTALVCGVRCRQD